MTTKLCKDCEHYQKKGYGEPESADNCMYKWPCYVTGNTRQTCCNYARWHELLCGASAKHFQPRKQSFDEWRKEHASQYVTAQEWLGAGGSWAEFKAVDHRLIELKQDDDAWYLPTFDRWNLNCDSSEYRIKLDANGNLPTRDWRQDIPWKEHPDAMWFAFEKEGTGYLYGSPVPTSEIWTSGRRYSTNLTLPENIDWRETLTPRPEGV